MAIRFTRANSEYLNTTSGTMTLPGNDAKWSAVMQVKTPSSFTASTVQMLLGFITTPGALDVIIGITVSGGGAATWYYGDSNAGFIDSGVSVSTSTLYRVGFTYDSTDTNNEYRLWVDDSNVSTGADGTTQAFSDAYVGRWSSNSHHFDGLIEGLKVWDSVRLTSDEIVAEGKTNAPRRLSGLIWWLPLITKSDGTEPDLRDRIQNASWTSFNTPTSESGPVQRFGPRKKLHYVGGGTPPSAVTFFGGIGAGVVGRLTA